MITDLDRLHKVVSGELQGRGCGTTFSKCHELVACVLLKELDYIVVRISEYRDINTYLLPMIDKVFLDYSLKFNKIKYTQLLCNDVIIDFVLSNKLWEDTRGCPDFYEIDMTRPVMYDREQDDLARRIAKYALQDKFILDDESVRYDREVLKNYKW